MYKAYQDYGILLSISTVQCFINCCYGLIPVSLSTVDPGYTHCLLSSTRNRLEKRFYFVLSDV